MIYCIHDTNTFKQKDTTLKSHKFTDGKTITSILEIETSEQNFRSLLITLLTLEPVFHGLSCSPQNFFDNV